MFQQVRTAAAESIRLIDLFVHCSCSLQTRQQVQTHRNETLRRVHHSSSSSSLPLPSETSDGGGGSSPPSAAALAPSEAATGGDAASSPTVVAGTLAVATGEAAGLPPLTAPKLLPLEVPSLGPAAPGLDAPPPGAVVGTSCAAGGGVSAPSLSPSLSPSPSPVPVPTDVDGGSSPRELSEDCDCSVGRHAGGDAAPAGVADVSPWHPRVASPIGRRVGNASPRGGGGGGGAEGTGARDGAGAVGVGDAIAGGEPSAGAWPPGLPSSFTPSWGAGLSLPRSRREVRRRRLWSSTSPRRRR